MIEVCHLTKRYGNHTAVSDLSFTIEKGQVYGFLGPNGAGKSTTMNIITGCLAASEGTVKIAGFDIFEAPKQAKALIGYLPEQPPLYTDRTPREYLTFVARAKGVAKSELQTQVNKVMEETQITNVSDRLIRNLSKGYRQRVGIAQALLGNPQVVILDEPTVGLDPRQMVEIRELIRELGKTRTVILSSHILSEVQALCTTILIISQGQLVAMDTPENLEKLLVGKTVVHLTAEGDAEQVQHILTEIEDLDDLEISSVGSVSNVRVSVANDREEFIRRELFAVFSKANCPILELSTEKANLEDVFMELTEAKEVQS